ncbi:MAG: alpha/beta hydrolase [Gordonia sp. (in: high G+C Gram-positive bacteria)]
MSTPPRPTPAAVSVRRRSVLLGAVGGLGLAATLSACGDDAEVPEPTAADDLLSPEPADPELPPGPEVVTGRFVSPAMGGQTVRWAAARPVGVTGRLPMVIVAHALNTNERTIFSKALNMQGVVQSHVDAGNPPFALAGVGIGNNYYHRRADGADSARLILDEFIPMLGDDARLDVRTDRFGLYGWSMGGYGALRLGAMVGAPQVAAIAVSAPALWPDPLGYPPRAFDSAEDYQANSLFGQQDAFAKIPLMISVGTSDQFYRGTLKWAEGLSPPAALRVGPGGHTDAFFRGALPEQVEFLGRNLGTYI